MRLAKGRGLSNEVIADALGLYENPSRKPAAPVYLALKHAEFYSQVFPANLALVVAKI